MNEEGWLKHTDKVLEQLVGVGDELSRVLTLPTSSRSYHRMIKKGRREAANIIEVSYRLFDSLYTQRIIKISKLSETLKEIGLAATEVSRIRQYERFIGEAIENLRMIKMYRTPQALRSFGRIFTLVLPCFYAPAFAQLAIDLNSISMGILFAILTPLVLTALFETMQIIEDPFVGWVSLDGIDVNEEMQILHFHQLISARNSLFPDAEPFEARSKAAIISLPMNSTELQKQISPLKPSLDGSQMTMERSHRVSHFSVEAIDHKPTISISQKGPLSLSGHTRDF